MDDIPCSYTPAPPAIGRVNSFRSERFRKHIHSSRGDANLLGESDETHIFIFIHRIEA